MIVNERSLVNPYMAWFQPAWEALSEDEQFVLSTFYGEENGYGTGAADLVADRFSIDRSSACRLKNRVLDRLAGLLYGK